jgi:hypothetical protein
MPDTIVERFTGTMKTITTKLSLLCYVVAVGLVVCLLGERRAWSGINQANEDLRLQLAQMGALLADNQRLLALLPEQSVRVSQSNPSDSMSALNEPARELLRLRGEAEALRQETKAIAALREDTRQARLVQQTSGKRSGNSGQTENSGTDSNGSQLEILRAVYGSDNVRADVTEELRDRIRGGSLKTIASNSLKGDPEVGQVKNLTIEYRYGGVTLTNQFREGALVVLPPEAMP